MSIRVETNLDFPRQSLRFESTAVGNGGKLSQTPLFAVTLPPP
jgi:hypothetical protein